MSIRRTNARGSDLYMHKCISLDDNGPAVINLWLFNAHDADCFGRIKCIIKCVTHA